MDARGSGVGAKISKIDQIKLKLDLNSGGLYLPPTPPRVSEGSPGATYLTLNPGFQSPRQYTNTTRAEPNESEICSCHPWKHSLHHASGRQHMHLPVGNFRNMSSKPSAIYCLTPSVSQNCQKTQNRTQILP